MWKIMIEKLRRRGKYCACYLSMHKRYSQSFCHQCWKRWIQLLHESQVESLLYLSSADHLVCIKLSEQNIYNRKKITLKGKLYTLQTGFCFLLMVVAIVISAELQRQHYPEACTWLIFNICDHSFHTHHTWSSFNILTNLITINSENKFKIKI